MIRGDAQRQHRLLPRAGLGIVAAMGVVLGVATVAGPALADEAVQTRAALIDGGARLVFDWPAPVAFNTTVSGNRVTISFERPLAATFDSVLQALPDRVTAMEIAGNGQSVVVTLNEASHVTSFAQGDLVVLDLRPTQGEPPTVAAESAEPASAEEPAATAELAEAAPAIPTAAQTDGAPRPPVPPATVDTPSSAPAASPAPPAPRIVDGILSVRYGLHDAYDRIVFDWPERVPYTVTNNGGLIDIRFDAVARIDSDALAARLPSRLRLVSADTDADSLVVTLAAPPGARVQDFYNYSKTVIDIYRDPSGAAPVAVPARPDQVAGAEPPAESPARSQVPAVVAEEPAQPAEPSAPAEPSGPAEPSEQAAESAEPAETSPEDAGQAADEPSSPPAASGGNASVLATLPPSPGLRRPQSETPPPPLRSEPEEEAPTVSLTEEEPAAAPEPALPGAEAPHAAEPAAVPPVTEAPVAEPPVAEEQVATRSPAVQPQPDSAAVAADEAGPASVDVVVIDGDFEALMRLRWAEPVRAAVVKRGDRIWIAFDQAVADFDMAAIRAGAGPIYDEPTLVETGGGLTFSVRVGEDVEPRITAAGNTWYVQIRPRQSESSIELMMERFDDPVLGSAIAFVSDDPPLDPGEPIEVLDPEIGDRFILVPIGAASAGLPRDAAFIQFHAIASAQGLAFDKLSDDVLVRTRDGRVEVVATGGLTLSDDQAARAAAAPQHAAADAVPAGSADAVQHSEGHDAPGSVTAPRGGVVDEFHLFDQATWRLEDEGSFHQVSRRLQAEAAAADGAAARAEARTRFARFLFGHSQFRDAGGVLRLITSDTPQLLAADASLVALRGATAYMNGEHDEAAIDLSDARLRPSSEAQYWRAAALAAQGLHEQAEAVFTEAADVPAWYDDELRIPLALASVDTAIAVDHFDRAAALLETLPYFDIDPRLIAELALRRAVAAWHAGDEHGAEEAWTEAIESGFDGLAARAVFDRTTAMVDAGSLAPDQAAQALDEVRYDWRGGDFERRLLRQLAEYQLAAGDYRSGFRTLKHARAVFTDDADRLEIDNRLHEAFAQLFGPTPPANISPITSIALFSEFEELAPHGPARDEMLRRLAGRLVGIDLYGEAAKVLHTLLLDDLLGPARGELGRDLAVLYLAAGEPQAAIDALLETRSRDFSELLDQQRRHLRASAHLALGDHPAALAALEEDSSPAADMLRAEIHWRDGDWAAAGAAFGRLAEGPSFVWPPAPPLLDAPADPATEPGADAAPDWVADPVPMLPSADEAAALDAPVAAEAAPEAEPVGYAARTAPLGELAAEQVLNWAMALTYADDQAGLAYLRQRYSAVMAETPYAEMFRLLAAEDFGPIASVADLGTVGPSIDMFERFLAGYRERLARDLSDPGSDAGADVGPAPGRAAG